MDGDRTSKLRVSSMRQLKSSTGDEMHRFNQVKDGPSGQEESSRVVHRQSCLSASESRGRSVNL